MQEINFTAPWSRVLLEKLTAAKLVMNMPAFYDIRMLIAMFRIVRQLERIMKKEIKVISTKITA